MRTIIELPLYMVYGNNAVVLEVKPDDKTLMAYIQVYFQKFIQSAPGETAYVRLRAFVEPQRCLESTLKCELRQTLARSGIRSEFML